MNINLNVQVVQTSFNIVSMKTLRVVASIIEKDNKILVAKRLDGNIKDMWEFPGGKYEENETGIEAIKREIKEELSVNIKVEKYLCTIYHSYEEFDLVMDCFVCSLIDEDIILHNHSAYKWINPNSEIEFAPADKKVIKEYLTSISQ